MADDAVGNIYTAWASNTSTGWRIFFSESMSGTDTFSAPLNLGSSVTFPYNDLSPSISVTGSYPTSHVMVTYLQVTGYPAASGPGDYFFVASTNGGSTFSTPHGDTSNGAISAGTVYDPVGAIDAQGDYLIAFLWNDPINGPTLGVNVYTTPTTYSNYYSEIPFAAGAYILIELSLACSPVSADGCAILYSSTNAADTLEYAYLTHSTNEFFTFSSSVSLSKARFNSADPATIGIEPGSLAYAPNGTDAASVFLWNSATLPTISYALNYTYTSNDWTSHSSGASPAGASRGLFDGYISLEGAAAAPFVTWTGATGSVLAAAAPTQSGAFGPVQTLASLGEGGAVAVTSAVVPWRADNVYVETSGTPEVEYGDLLGPSTSAPVPNNASTDVSQRVTFSTSAKNGLAPYSFAWTASAGLGCVASTASSLNCTTTSAGTGNAASVTITDAGGFTFTATSAAYTIYADPTISGFTTNHSTRDVNQTVQWTPTLGNVGSGIVSYAWTASSGNFGCGPLSGATLSCLASAGSSPSYNVTLIVTDSNGCKSGTAGSCAGSPLASSGYIVYPDPVISAFTASPRNISLGTSTYLNVTVTGGTPSPTYSFGGLPTGCSSTNTSSLPCTPTANGTFTITATAIDMNGMSSSHAVNLTVGPIYPSPTITSFTASPSNFTQGGTTYLNVTAAGGTRPYTYVYTGLPSGCSTTNQTSLLCTPSVNGTFTVTVKVVDMHAMSATSSVTFTVKPVVILPLAITGFTASPPLVAVGGTTYLNVSATGGVLPYRYVYVGLPGGCSTSNTSSLLCTPTAAGTFPVTVTVTDPAARMANKTLNLTVRVPPSVTAFTASPNPVTSGSSTTFTATISGGSSPFSFLYTGLPVGCTSVSLNPFTCTPTAPGNYSVAITVTDSNGLTGAGYTTLTVTPMSLPVVTAFTASPNPVTLGNSTQFSVSVSGGLSPYSYVYTGLPSGCVSSSASSIVCTPTVTGNFTVRVTVTDSNGASNRSTRILEVEQPTQNPLMLSPLTATPNPVAMGSSTTLSVTATGGITPYAYSYSGLPSGCPSADTSSLSCTPTASGSFSVTVTVTDRAGSLKTTSVLLQVTSVIPPITVELTSSVSSVATGTSFTLTAVASGGEGSFTYEWAINGTNVSSGPNSLTWSDAIPHAGTYRFNVWATDGRGYSGMSPTVTVTVVPTSTNHAAGPGFPWWILVVVLLIAAVLAVLIATRRRKSGKSVATGARYGDEYHLMGSDALGPPQSQSMVAASSMDASAAVAQALRPEGSTEGSSSASSVSVESARAEPPAMPVEAPRSDYASLTNCPECTAPLGSDMICRVCGTSWVREPVSAPASPIQPEPGAPPPPTTSLLAHCPQCGGAMEDDMACHTCGVSWVPDGAPPPVAELELEAPAPVPEPSGSQVESVSPAETTSTEISSPPAEPAVTPPEPDLGAVPDPLPPVLEPEPPVPPSSTPLEELSPSILPGSEALATPMTQTPSLEEPHAEAPLPSSTPDSEPPASLPIRACFICGSALEGNYCPVCDMHWDDPEPQ